MPHSAEMKRDYSFYFNNKYVSYLKKLNGVVDKCKYISYSLKN